MNVSGSAVGTLINSVTVAGGGDANLTNNTTTDPTNIASFTVSLGPSAATVMAGQSAAYNVVVTGMNGFAGTVNLTYAGAPPGATVAFNPASVAGSGQSTMAVSTAPQSAGGLLGNYNALTVVATSGSSSQSASTSLTIRDFVLTVAPAVQSLPCTGSVTYQIQAAGQNGFNAPLDAISGINFYNGSASVSPPGSVSASVSAGVGWLTIATTQPSTCNPMAYTIAISGTAGGFTRSNSAELDLNLNTGNPPNFSIDVVAQQSSTQPGQSASYSTRITPKYGFAGQVNLSAAGLPSGATASFTQNPVVLTSTAVTTAFLTVNTSASTPSGSFTITITATAASGSPPPSHYTIASLSTGPSFVLPPPAPITIDANGSASTTQYVTAVNGFSAPVTFSYSGWPTGLTATFGPSSVVPSGSTIVTLTADSTYIPGDYTLQLTGTSGGTIAVAPVVVHKNQNPPQMGNDLAGGCGIPDDGTPTACNYHIEWGHGSDVGNCHVLGPVNVVNVRSDSSVNLTITFSAGRTAAWGLYALQCSFQEKPMNPTLHAVTVYDANLPMITSVQPCTSGADCSTPPATITPGDQITINGYDFGPGGVLNLCASDGSACNPAPWDMWSPDGTQVTTTISQAPGTYSVQIASGTTGNALLASNATPADSNLWQVVVQAAGCAVPINFRQNGPGVDKGDGRTLHVEYAYDSTTGNQNDLSGCQFQEYVTYLDANSKPIQQNPYQWPKPFSIVMQNDGSQNPTQIAIAPGSGIKDDQLTGGAFVPPYTQAMVRAVQYYQYKCGCQKTNTWLNLAGPFWINRSIDPNTGGTWRYSVCKTNWAPVAPQTLYSCVVWSPLP